MEMITAPCPICHASNDYGAELVGRYTFCPGCGARFYVEVPPLGQPPKNAPFPGRIDVAVKRDTTLDDLLWDTQQGTRFIIASLRNQEAGAKATRGLVLVAIALGVVNLAALALLWLRLH